MSHIDSTESWWIILITSIFFNWNSADKSGVSLTGFGVGRRRYRRGRSNVKDREVLWRRSRSGHASEIRKLIPSHLGFHDKKNQTVDLLDHVTFRVSYFEHRNLHKNTFFAIWHYFSSTSRITLIMMTGK